MTNTIAVGLWNTNKAAANSPFGEAVRRRIEGWQADIVILSKTRIGVVPAHARAVGSGRPYPTWKDCEAVVVATQHKIVSHARLDTPPGRRAVAAVIATPVGQVQVLGICIPYAGWRGPECAGRWEAHEQFLDGLGTALATLDPTLPTIVGGDFNQPPRTPPHLAQQLSGELASAGLTTVVDIGGVDRLAIDDRLRLVDPPLMEAAVLDGGRTDRRSARATLTLD